MSCKKCFVKRRVAHKEKNQGVSPSIHLSTYQSIYQLIFYPYFYFSSISIYFLLPSLRYLLSIFPFCLSKHLFYCPFQLSIYKYLYFRTCFFRSAEEEAPWSAAGAHNTLRQTLQDPAGAGQWHAWAGRWHPGAGRRYAGAGPWRSSSWCYCWRRRRLNPRSTCKETSI